MRHRNELPVPTVVHLHGGHTPADSDGWPLDLVLPVGDTSDRTHPHGGAAMVGDVEPGVREYRYCHNLEHEDMAMMATVRTV